MAPAGKVSCLGLRVDGNNNLRSVPPGVVSLGLLIGFHKIREMKPVQLIFYTMLHFCVSRVASVQPRCNDLTYVPRCGAHQVPTPALRELELAGSQAGDSGVRIFFSEVIH